VFEREVPQKISYYNKLLYNNNFVNCKFDAVITTIENIKFEI